jgi:hypothetical protein
MNIQVDAVGTRLLITSDVDIDTSPIYFFIRLKKDDGTKYDRVPTVDTTYTAHYDLVASDIDLIGTLKVQAFKEPDGHGAGPIFPSSNTVEITVKRNL